MERLGLAGGQPNRPLPSVSTFARRLAISSAAAPAAAPAAAARKVTPRITSGQWTLKICLAKWPGDTDLDLTLMAMYNEAV